MDTNGFGRMLGRGFGSLIKNVDANKLINTLEQKMLKAPMPLSARSMIQKPLLTN